MRMMTWRQPWAQLIADGVKLQDVRRWAVRRSSAARPEWDIVGEMIGIYAGRSTVATGLPDAVSEAVKAIYGTGWADEVPRGAVVATARVASAQLIRVINGHTGEMFCEQAGGHRLVRHVEPYGEYDPGMVLWEFEAVRKLPEPIVLDGKNGGRLWRAPGLHGATEAV